jgi:hypothetical protein
MNFFAISATALLLMQSSVGVHAQTMDSSVASPPTAAADQKPSFQMQGYGRLRFGMDAEQVQSLLRRDFPQANPVLIDKIDAISRSRVLTLELPALEPGPGAATISCVFGANSQRLMAVNVIWTAPDPAGQAQEKLWIHAAAKLAQSHAAQAWPLFGTTYGTVVAPGVSVVFTGHDEAGGAAEIRLQGVATPFGAASGPLSLRLTLVANSHNPDIFRIPAGAF